MLDKLLYTNQYDLRYLMTSDFTENHSPSTYKYLLQEFRNHYRVLDNKNTQLDRKVNSEKEYIDKLRIENEKLKKERDIFIKKYRDLRNKKLSWKERIFGKIK